MARRAEQERQAEIARQERLEQPPKKHEGRTFLDQYAMNIHTSYEWGEYGTRATTAVGILESPRGLRRYQVAPQRVMSDMKDYAVTHYGEILTKEHFTTSIPERSHIHAEMWLLYWGTKKGHKLQRIGVSKKICPNCQYVLKRAGVAFDAEWADDVRREDWQDPWEYYGEKNPFLGD